MIVKQNMYVLTDKEVGTLLTNQRGNDDKQTFPTENSTLSKNKEGTCEGCNKTLSTS